MRGYPTGHRIPKNLLFSESEGTDEVQAILCITAPQDSPEEEIKKKGGGEGGRSFKEIGEVGRDITSFAR